MKTDPFVWWVCEWLLDVKPTQAQPVGDGDELVFSPPKKWQSQFTSQLEAAGRLQKVTLPALLRGGATHFAWINPDERFEASGEKWTPSAYGGFVYLMGGKQDPVYFAKEP